MVGDENQPAITKKGLKTNLFRLSIEIEPERSGQNRLRRPTSELEIHT